MVSLLESWVLSKITGCRERVKDVGEFTRQWGFQVAQREGERGKEGVGRGMVEQQRSIVWRKGGQEGHLLAWGQDGGL